MIVLGADLSYTCSGFAWLTDDYTCVWSRTCTIKPGPRRMCRAAKSFLSCIQGQHIDLCIIEDLAYGAPSRTVVTKLAELAAIFKLELEAHDNDYLVVSPSAIKKHITGKGTAEKHVVAQALKALHNIEFKNDKGYDLSDAAAAACWGVNFAIKKT